MLLFIVEVLVVYKNNRNQCWYSSTVSTKRNHNHSLHARQFNEAPFQAARWVETFFVSMTGRTGPG